MSFFYLQKNVLFSLQKNVLFLLQKNALYYLKKNGGRGREMKLNETKTSPWQQGKHEKLYANLRQA